MKRSIKILFTSAASILTLLVLTGAAFAQGADEAAVKLQGLASSYGTIAIAAAFGIGLAALGGALAQGRAAAAALDGIARNPGAAPRIQTPMILGLALIESLVLLGFVIAFFLQGYAKP